MSSARLLQPPPLSPPPPSQFYLPPPPPPLLICSPASMTPPQAQTARADTVPVQVRHLPAALLRNQPAGRRARVRHVPSGQHQRGRRRRKRAKHHLRPDRLPGQHLRLVPCLHRLPCRQGSPWAALSCVQLVAQVFHLGIHVEYLPPMQLCALCAWYCARLAEVADWPGKTRPMPTPVSRREDSGNVDNLATVGDTICWPVRCDVLQDDTHPGNSSRFSCVDNSDCCWGICNTGLVSPVC